MPKIKGLPPEWVKWRSSRRREMVASGMGRESAERVSDAEARGRARIAEHVGFSAASKAALVRVPDGKGGEKFALMLDPRDVPDWRRDEAEAALNPDVVVRV